MLGGGAHDRERWSEEIVQCLRKKGEERGRTGSGSYREMRREERGKGESVSEGWGESPIQGERGGLGKEEE